MNDLVLSLFPGIDLLGRVFEEEGFCVVRGPDVLWGGNITDFHPPAGIWGGIIGGAPCQAHSVAVRMGTKAVDLIPEFVRVVNEAQPRWVVMENVRATVKHPGIPTDWNVRILRDWDCGGETARTRAIYTWPFLLPVYPKRAGQPEYSVMASTVAHRGKQARRRGFLPSDLPTAEYGRLQGVGPEFTAALEAAYMSRATICHLLGNGVPMALGRAIARAVKQATPGATGRQPVAKYEERKGPLAGIEPLARRPGGPGRVTSSRGGER